MRLDIDWSSYNKYAQVQAAGLHTVGKVILQMWRVQKPEGGG